MNRKLFSLIFISGSFLFHCKSFAQSCYDNLHTAANMLDAGNAESCLNLVLPCSAEGNEISTRWQAFRLMSMAYLLKGNTDSAKISAEHMLELNPTYKTSALKDPAELMKLINSTIVVPKISFGLAITLGGSFTYPNVFASVNPTPINKKYKSGKGYLAALFGGYQWNKNCSVHLGFVISSKAYSIQYTVSNWSIDINEKLTYIEIPINLRYAFRHTKRLRPFFEAGVNPGYLSSSYNDFQRTWVNNGDLTSLLQIASENRRLKMSFGITMCTGISYKISGRLPGHIDIMINGVNSFTNITNKSSRYNNDKLFYDFYYLDDDLRLNNLLLSVGYTVYLNYKVIKSGAK